MHSQAARSPLGLGGSPVPHCPQDIAEQRSKEEDLRVGRDNSLVTGPLLPEVPYLQGTAHWER